MRRLDPENPFSRGVGTATALADEIDTDELAAKRTRKWFENGATPDLLVSVEGPATDELRAAQEQWNQEYRGFWNAFKSWWTNGKITARLDTSFKDMDLVNLRRFERDTIGQTRGLPPGGARHHRLELLDEGRFRRSTRGSSKMRRADLSEQIADRARTAWRLLRRAHPEETFYFYGLYTTDDGAYVVPTAWSEEALGAAARRTKLPPERLRFSAPDSPYHAAHADDFAGLPADPRVVAACKRALRRLDEEGFFGRGRKRESVIVNVVYGDMSDDRWLAHATGLNPPAAVDNALPYLTIAAPSPGTRRFGGRAYQVNALSLSADSTLAAYSGSGGEVGVFRLGRRPSKMYLKTSRGSHWASAIAPDGRRVYVGDHHGIDVLELASGKVTPWVATEAPSQLKVSPDGRRIAVSSHDGPVKIFSVEDGTVVAPRGKTTQPCGIAFSPDGRYLACAGKELAVVETANGRVVARHPLGNESRVPVAWSPDGKRLAAHSPARSAIAVLQWPRLTVARLVPVERGVNDLAFSPSGARFAACIDAELVVYDADDGRQLVQGNGKQEQLIACVMPSDGEALAVGRDVDAGKALLSLSVAGTR